MLAWNNAAQAATAEAHRHVSVQGIEYISSRKSAADAPSESLPVALARPSRANSSVMAPSRPATASTTAAVPLSGHATVSLKEQRLRDQDRLAILHQELSAETGHYQRTRQALDHPAVKGGADRDAWMRLSEQLGRHEQNIKALHAEIGRMNPPNDRR